MLQLRDNENVLCSANQAYYHERNLQPSFGGGGWGEGEWVLGISEGVRHASNKDGFYIVHYNQANGIAKGLIGRRKWQAKLCLFGSPLFSIKTVLLCKVFCPLFSFSYMKRTLLLVLYSLQVNFSSSERINRRWLVFPCFCKGNILRVGFLIFAETSCTEGLIG